MDGEIIDNLKEKMDMDILLSLIETYRKDLLNSLLLILNKESRIIISVTPDRQGCWGLTPLNMEMASAFCWWYNWA